MGGRGRRSSVTHTAPGRPAYPTPVCPVPIWASSGWDSQGGSTLGPKGVGEGQAQADKEPGRGGHSARPEETVAQCPASPRRTVGSCSQTAPHGGNPNSISAALTPRFREKPQSRGGRPAWVTQHLSHSGNIHGRPPGPAQHLEIKQGWLTKQVPPVGTQPSRGMGHKTTLHLRALHPRHFQQPRTRGGARDEAEGRGPHSHRASGAALNSSERGGSCCSHQGRGREGRRGGSHRPRFLLWG